MIKSESLRAALVAALPEFAEDPDRLKLFVDAGQIRSRRTAELGFAYCYTLRIFVDAFTGGPDALMLPIVLWVREHQPDLFLRFAQDADAIEFAADILDATSWDIAISLPLTEAVLVTPAADGSGWTIEHQAEPSPDDPLLAGALQDVPLATLSFGDEQLLPR